MTVQIGLLLWKYMEYSILEKTVGPEYVMYLQLLRLERRNALIQSIISKL